MYVLCAYLEESILSLLPPMLSFACAEFMLQNFSKTLHMP